VGRAREIQRPAEALVILGGGPIGVEMAQAFARLGSTVTLVQSGERICPGKMQTPPPSWRRR
jgi:pyruvate/2-oxoglutarate dehydrogenase complex dihydrolipoamide dehydrogenase (E3) component